MPLQISAGAKATVYKQAVDDQSNTFSPTIQHDFRRGETPPWLSFSRAGNAMYYDSTGTLKWAPANMLTYSEQFNDASWAKNNCTVTADSIAAPNGSNTADTIVATGTEYVYVSKTLPTLINGQQYTLSLYVKAGTKAFCTIGLQSCADAYFDLNNLTYSFTGTGAVTASIVDVGNSWRRISATWTWGSSTTYIAYMAIASSLNSQFSITVGDTLHTWGAQLEPVTYQTAPSAYIPTTSAAVYSPRYDYDPSTVPATPRGLLIEEQRVNSLLNSNLPTRTWTVARLQTPTSGNIAPDGTTNGWKITEDNTPSANHALLQSISSTANTAYTVSFFAKYGSGRNVQIATYDGTNSASAIYNLNSSSATLTPVSTSGTITSNSCVAVGNGWYRLSMTVTTTLTTGTTLSLYYGLANGTTNIYSGDNASFAYFFGAQLEAGSFATSYIPTTTASVTRAADVAQLTGSALTTFGAATGSAAIQTTALRSVANTLGLLSSSATVYPIYVFSGLNTTVTSYNGSSNLSATLGGSATWTGSQVRVSLGWDTNGRSIVANNGTVATDANTFGSRTANAYLGTVALSNNMNGWIASLALYNTRLPDAILKQKSAIGAPY